MPGKRVQFDDETWQAIDLLARDTMKDFQELADEAFGDLLRKHDRPVTLKQALRASAREAGAERSTAGPASAQPAPPEPPPAKPAPAKPAGRRRKTPRSRSR
jgi:hypothetical protein